jgi:hypothetical protein
MGHDPREDCAHSCGRQPEGVSAVCVRRQPLGGEDPQRLTLEVQWSEDSAVWPVRQRVAVERSPRRGKGADRLAHPARRGIRFGRCDWLARRE